MSFQFPEPKNRLDRVIAMFIAESTQILDESVPYTRRVALLYKWSWILRGLGYQKPLERKDLTEEEINEKIKDMLEWVSAVLLRTKSMYH